MICFGFSWPVNIIKSWKVRTTRGKSLAFLICIQTGYGCGIAAKLLSDRINYVCIFYCLNFIMVGIDIILYFRNLRLDRIAENPRR
jgi:hypothetical protein